MQVKQRHEERQATHQLGSEHASERSGETPSPGTAADQRRTVLRASPGNGQPRHHRTSMPELAPSRSPGDNIRSPVTTRPVQVGETAKTSVPHPWMTGINMISSSGRVSRRFSTLKAQAQALPLAGWRADCSIGSGCVTEQQADPITRSVAMIGTKNRRTLRIFSGLISQSG